MPTSPRRNRVTPFGGIEAVPDRGTMMGNRGILHDAAGEMGAARWRHRAWVTCQLVFRSRRHPIAAPGRYTPLFFTDEAVAFAAGHRPCFECRRVDALRFRAAWHTAHRPGTAEPVRVAEMDRTLHAARLARPALARLPTLPDGTFVARPCRPAQAYLLWRDALYPWSQRGYGSPMAAKDEDVTVLTPMPSVSAFRAGYRPSVALEP